MVDSVFALVMFLGMWSIGMVVVQLPQCVLCQDCSMVLSMLCLMIDYHSYQLR